MLINYLKVTLRNLLKNRVSTFINLFGLSTGICTSLVVFLVISYETDFDGFHSKSDKIFRIVRHETATTREVFSSSLPFPMDGALRNDFPELTFTQVFAATEYQFKYQENIWEEEHVLFADSSFFKVFDFELVEGNAIEAMKHPKQMLITESVAATHFGESPVGKMVSLGGMMDVEVAGVIKDVPGNSHLPFSVVFSIGTFEDKLVGGIPYDNWGTSLGFSDYVLLPDELKREDVESGLSAFKKKYYSEENADKVNFFLQPLAAIHFDTRYADSNPGYTLDPKYLWILGSVGFFVLMLACINFINLSTAISVRKSKEVGVRKTMGASRSQLVYQYLGEALVLTLIAVLVSMGITERILPFLNHFMDATISFSLLNQPKTLYFIAISLLVVTLMSGFYPAWVLSRYQPVAALKSKVTGGGSAQGLRKVLVTAQFVISQVLIVGTIIIAQQMDFFRNKPLGFSKDSILGVSLNGQDTVKMETLKARLLAHSNIESVALGSGAPTSENDIGTEMRLEGSDLDYRVRIKPADVDYLRTYEVELAAGRWLSQSRAAASGGEFVINESALKSLGFASADDVIGKRLTIGVNNMTSPIVGVVRDFHMKPLYESIEPVVLFEFPRLYFEAGVKISDQNVPQTLQFIQRAWAEVYPDGFFDYYFLDDALARNYEREEKLYLMFQAFSLMSIGIGCLGLFGLISFLVIQKTKEVGVRKVMGASVSSIVILFSRDFMKLIVIAFLFAVPIAWYLMNTWLNDFAYRIDVTAWYFVWGGAISVIIAMLTISVQAFKAAMANPVDSLRYE